MCAPPSLLPDASELHGCTVHAARGGADGVDVVMMLRLHREDGVGPVPSLAQYYADYGCGPKYCEGRPDAIVLPRDR